MKYNYMFDDWIFTTDRSMFVIDLYYLDTAYKMILYYNIEDSIEPVEYEI